MLPSVRALVAVPVVPVVTVEGTSVPPPDVMLSVTTTPAAGFPLASVAVTVTVAVEPGAPLPGCMPTATVGVCDPDPAPTVIVICRPAVPALTVAVYVFATAGSVIVLV